MVSWSLLISCLAYRLVVITVKDCLTDKFCLDKKNPPENEDFVPEISRDLVGGSGSYKQLPLQ